MSHRLAGKVAIVTAAGSGIGRACAMRFGAEGARVIVNDIDPEAARSVADEIVTGGGTSVAAAGDVSDPERITAIIRDTAEREGRLDILLNNAASPQFGRVEDMTDALWRGVFAVTLDATFFGMRAALPIMGAQGSGSIINTASAAGLGGVAFLGAYGAAKAAVVNLTKTAALESASRGVRVNVICPGSIDTPPLRVFVDNIPGGRAAFERTIPVKRIGQPEEIASVATFLASEDAAYVTGAVIVADGGVVAGIGPGWPE